MENNLPKVEGLSPEIIWYTLIGVVGLCAIWLLYDKVADSIRKRVERKKNQHMPEGLDGKLSNINDRLDNIDATLRSHKEMLDRDKRRLDEIDKKQEDIQNGFRAMAMSVMALLNNSLNIGSEQEMKDAKKELSNYLFRR